jgi:tryptophanyl-tRNA synthetase
MTEVKQTIAAKIREYRTAYPNATMKEIAEAFGTSPAYVHQSLFPKGKKRVKAKKASAPKSSNTAQEQLIVRLRNELAEYQKNEESFDKVSKKLVLEIVECRAVISYLERKLKDAASV